MKGASKSKEPRHAKQQSQRILSFREGEYQDSNKKIPSVARGSYLMRRSHKKQLISSGNCCKTAVTGGKSGPSLKQNQTAAFWRGGRLRLAMPKMKEQNSRSRKEADGAARIFNLTRIEGFVKGEIAKIFRCDTFGTKSQIFQNFSKIIAKYDTSCRIQSGKIKKKQEEAKR